MMNKLKIIIDNTQLDRILKNILQENITKYRELSEEEEENAYAAFVVVKLPDGKIAATTRPYEKSEQKKIGLPGGKVEKNESPIDAAYRESEEEGWKVSKITKIIASKMVDGRPIVYYEGINAKKLKTYKEKNNNIIPISVSVEKISQTGYGNSFIKDMYNDTKKEDVDEQSEPSSEPQATTQTASDGYPQVGKWESGIKRGPANQVGVTKWADIVGSTLTRGKANQLK